MGTELEQLEIIADFINTHDRRMRYEGDSGVELLTDADGLRSWLLRYNFIHDRDNVSDEDLVLARELRSSLRAAINHNPHDHHDGFQSMNRAAGQFRFFYRFGEATDVIESVDVQGKGGIARLLILVFRLRENHLWDRLRVCMAADCQWVFVDRSRPGTGKWCSMKACGNRAKNKTYRERAKSG
ncbi:hypothetical protein JCM10914A_16850 [Paenibacillus sp. JCM 10914]